MGGMLDRTWFAQYLDGSRCRGFSPTTLRNMELSLRSFVKFLAARSVRLADITPGLLQEYGRHLAVAHANAPGTVWMRLLAARRFLNFLTQGGVLSPDVVRGTVLPALPRSLPRLVLSRNQAHAILATPNFASAKGIRDSAILEVLYSTGLRLAELALLITDDVHLEEALIHVRHAKFNRDRFVPLGVIAVERLRTYIEQVRPAWLKPGVNPPDLWLSAIQPHQPISPPAIACIVRRIAKAAGIRAVVSPHVWRHTCATHLVRRGAPLIYVQQLLGHRSVNTTQIYARVAITDLQRTFARTHPRAQERSLHVPAPRFD